MQKKGGMIIIIIVVVVLVLLAGLFGLLLFAGGNTQTEAETTEEIVEETQEQQEEEPEPEVEEPNETIQTPAANQTNQTQENQTIAIDLVPLNLTLVNEGCDEDGNGTLIESGNCTIAITGIVANTGNANIPESFIVHLFETTSTDDLVDVFTISSLKPEEEAKLTASYKVVYEDKRFFQLKVDVSNAIEETDETNNILSQVIKLP